MIFGRKTPPSVNERIRVSLWPRRSFLRSGKYYFKRVLRLSGSPYVIGIGVAAGVFISFTPFIGFHLLLSWGLALVLGGNLLAATLGTAIGNPITFPLIWGTTYWLGCLLTGTAGVHHNIASLKDQLLNESFSTILPTIKLMAIGGVPIGLGFALGFYFLVHRAAKLHQYKRKIYLSKKAFKDGRWREVVAEHEHDHAHGHASQ